MIVLDTNVIVRLITKDDIDQAMQAFDLLRGPGPFWISRVVLLETAWTLKSRYGYSREQISQALSVVAGLEGAEVEDRGQVQQAVALYGPSSTAQASPDQSKVVSMTRSRKADMGTSSF